MSYSLNVPCGPCVKQGQCTDRASIAGAISGIHQMPFGAGHLGSGTVTINCNNLQEPQPESVTEPGH